LNAAYRTLRDPWQRAQYLLDSHHVKPACNVPTSLAEYYFELQDMDDRAALVALKAKLEEEEKERNQNLRKKFFRYDRNPSEQNSLLQEIAMLVSEHSYSQSMRRDIETRLEKSE
jgi:hypothetical protein